MLVRFKNKDLKCERYSLETYLSDTYPEFYFAHVIPHFATNYFHKYEGLYCDNHYETKINCIYDCIGHTRWVYFGKMRWRYVSQV